MTLKQFREALDNLERAYFDMCNSTQPDGANWEAKASYTKARCVVEILHIQEIYNQPPVLDGDSSR